MADPGNMIMSSNRRRTSEIKEKSVQNSVFKETTRKDSPVKETIGNEDEDSKIEKTPNLHAKTDSFDYNEDDLPTVGADIKMGKVVPQFTEIKVKSKLDHSQPTRVDKADVEKTIGDGGHQKDKSESDFGDLEFADFSD